ncbi:RNA 2',3'-cyclic phosphodiesterase [Cumulibacter soli]|uniref:RNA 2',3'-cyclic phosphodiesterase n=1 Tax=Cumulibacter soli TaxID=2546344 RepID=UPI0010671C7D|nr:RNA 2',3'-cyclic phosphodiesterase [Cumulibacter soli]
MRLFTAITPPADIIDGLDERLDVLREIRTDLRWVRADNLHVTVRFLGECGEREADRQIEHWRDRCARLDPFEVRLRGAGCFPHVWMAKVLYAAVECDARSWTRLAPLQSTPHLTVARSRQQVDLTGVVDELAELTSAPWCVDQVSMFRSFLEPGRAPRYVPIETFRLGGCDGGAA